MRLTNAVTNKTFNDGTEERAMLDVRYGGQQGYMNNLGLTDSSGTYREWINNSAYVQRNVIPFVLQTPRFFQYMPEQDRLNETLISILESHVETYDGLQRGITLETDEHAVGAAGEFQEEAVRATRARTTLSMTLREKQGKPFNRFLNMWITYGILDPDTQRPLATALDTYNGDVNDIWTPDQYTTTILFVEPDFAHRNVVEAWLCTNVFPKSDGEVTGRRDLQAAGEMKVYSIELSSITVSNAEVRAFGQDMLNKLSVLKTDPNTVPVFLDTDRPESSVATNEFNFNRPIEY